MHRHLFRMHVYVHVSTPHHYPVLKHTCMFYFSSHFWGFKKGNTSLKCNSNQFNIIFFIGKPFFVTQIFQIKKEQFFKFFTGIYNERFWHLIPIRKFLEHLTQFFNIVIQGFSFVCKANPLSILFSKLKLSSWKECFKEHIRRLFSCIC